MGREHRAGAERTVSSSGAGRNTEPRDETLAGVLEALTEPDPELVPWHAEARLAIERLQAP